MGGTPPIYIHIYNEITQRRLRSLQLRTRSGCPDRPGRPADRPGSTCLARLAPRIAQQALSSDFSRSKSLDGGPEKPLRVDFGRSRGSPDPRKSCSRVDENANSEKSHFCSWKGSRTPLGLTLDCSGPLWGLCRASSGSSWGAPGCSESVLGHSG